MKYLAQVQTSAEDCVSAGGKVHLELLTWEAQNARVETYHGEQGYRVLLCWGCHVRTYDKMARDMQSATRDQKGETGEEQSGDRNNKSHLLSSSCMRVCKHYATQENDF